MKEQKCIPSAPTLIESMRSIGYSFPTAIADLIDNSISAKATEISIISEPSAEPWLIIFDNGCGMSKKELFEAMRYGSKNPLDERSKDDLGRYGLGLKSASLSQCRHLVVVSKKDGKISSYSWNLDLVIEKGEWVLECFSDSEIRKFIHIDMLDEVKSGTYILLQNFDRIKESTANITTTFNKNLVDMESHLALVFHRFIDEDGLVIKLNDIKIKARDPFLASNPATQKKRENKIYIDNEEIIIKSFILPHISKLKDKDIEKLGGKDKIRSEQGFYIYRNRRLIIWGTWFRITKKEELNKLARVRVDIPNSLDYMWSIDVKKSTATLPDKVKHNLYSAVDESIRNSQQVYTYRGRKEIGNKDIETIWNKIKTRDGYRYEINRNIPQIKTLTEGMDTNQIKLLESIINEIEESFPIHSAYTDMANGEIKEKEKKSVDDIWEELQLQMKYVNDNGLNVQDFYQAFMKTEPYCRYEEIKEKIRKELEKYE